MSASVAARISCRPRRYSPCVETAPAAARIATARSPHIVRHGATDRPESGPFPINSVYCAPSRAGTAGGVQGCVRHDVILTPAPAANRGPPRAVQSGKEDGVEGEGTAKQQVLPGIQVEVPIAIDGNREDVLARCGKGGVYLQIVFQRFPCSTQLHVRLETKTAVPRVTVLCSLCSPFSDTRSRIGIRQTQAVSITCSELRFLIHSHSKMRQKNQAPDRDAGTAGQWGQIQLAPQVVKFGSIAPPHPHHLCTVHVVHFYLCLFLHVNLDPFEKNLDQIRVLFRFGQGLV